MYDDEDNDGDNGPDRERPDEDPGERVAKPADRAREKSDEFRMHAELFAVFEAGRKFEADLRTDLAPELARDVQRTMAKLERSRSPESPILPPASVDEAARLLNLPATEGGPTTNDYHVSRRPGEVMVARWLAAEQVDTFYERLQAHFDVAFGGYRDDEKSNNQWKGDARTLAFIEALDQVDVKMADRYLRDPTRQLGVLILSTQTADEINISYLADYVMGINAAELVGAASAPPEDGATDHDRAWFFKLFSLRGAVDGVDRMCFFAFLQKAEDTFDLGE